MGSTGLKTISIPSSVTKIEDDVFHGCTNLQSLIIPNSVTSIGNDAFYDCYRLVLTIPKCYKENEKIGLEYCKLVIFY